MKNSINCIFLGLFLIFGTGCADLKEVNTFSGVAEKTVKSMNDIDYYFYQERTIMGMSQNIFNEIKYENIKRNRLTLPLIDSIKKVDTLALKADAAINMISSSLTFYFQALNKISDKTLVNYNYKNLAKELKGDKTLMAKLKLTDDKIDASTKIATIFTNSIMGHYRNKIIVETIINNNSDVGKVIDALCLIINSAIIPAIDSDLGNLQSQYTPLLSDSLIDLKIKFDWIRNYGDESAKLINSREKEKKMIAGLLKIKQGHDALSQKLVNKKLSSNDVKELINEYAGDIYNIYQGFIKLTNKD